MSTKTTFDREAADQATYRFAFRQTAAAFDRMLDEGEYEKAERMAEALLKQAHKMTGADAVTYRQAARDALGRATEEHAQADAWSGLSN